MHAMSDLVCSWGPGKRPTQALGRQLKAVKKGIPGSQVGQRELLVGTLLPIELWGA